MFSSLRKWMNVPITVMPFLKRDGTGNSQYSASILTTCYPKADAQVITNNAGVEVKSGTQLYVDGKVLIKEQDAVLFEGIEREVRAVTNYYRDGIPDIRVVYL